MTHFRIFLATLFAVALTASSLSAAALRLGNSSTGFSRTAVFRDVWYFPVDSPGRFGSDVWRTDGTAAGTWQVTDLKVGSADSLQVMGDELYFVNSYLTAVLYATDGTAEGTRSVVTLASSPNSVVASGSLLYFFSYMSDRGGSIVELTRSDGTANGTFRLAEFPSGDYNQGVRSSGELLYFQIGNGYRTPALWRTDGSVAGTFRLTEGHSLSAPSGMYGNAFLFTKGSEVWSTDGTVAGTHALLPNASVAGTTQRDAYLWSDGALVKLDHGTGQPTLVKKMEQPTRTVADGDRLFLFRYAAPAYVAVTDGTPQGTTIVPLIGSPLIDASPGAAAVAKGFVCFDLFTTSGVQLWRSDGTAAGTTMVRDSDADPYSYPWHISAIGDKVAFSADDGLHGREPWITDGTIDGTRMIANLYPEATVRGTVTDAATGAPLRDAVVRVSEPPDCLSCERRAHDYPVDADGRYTIEGLAYARYSFTVRNPGGGHIPQNGPGHDCFACEVEAGETFLFVPGQTRDGFDFALRRSGRFAGRIVDVKGTPVPGVQVCAAATFGTRPVACAVSGADGAYRTTDPIPYDKTFLLYTTGGAGYSGVIYPATSCSAGCNAQSSGTRVQAGIGETRRGIDFTVRPWGKIKGRVLDNVTGKAAVLEGVPLAVTFSPGGRVQAIVTGGEFTMSIPDGQVHLLFVPLGEKSGYRGTWFPDVRCRLDDCSQWYQQNSGTAVTGVPGETREGYDVHLEPIGGRIEGRVTAAGTGAAIGGVVVRIADRGGLGVANVITDASGNYVTPPLLGPDQYSVQTTGRAPWFPVAYADGGKPCRPFDCAGTYVEVSGQAVRSGIDLQLERFASAIGLVVDATTRQPLRDVEITLRRAGVPDLVATTNARGRYTTSALRTGAYVLTASKPGWTTVTLGVNIIRHGTTIESNIAMQPAATN